MRKVKILLIVLSVANHFSHATTKNYEEQFPDEKEKESIDNFIAGETKSFLDKLNKKREEENKDKITMEQIQNDEEVTKENAILIDILNNFSTTLKDQNENRGKKIGYIEIDKKKYCYKLKIEAEKGIMFTSDTHAEADKVEKIWYFFDQLKQKNEVDKLVFLGDYGDRGNCWTYTYFLLAAMAEKYGEDIIFIRGNHEDREIALIYSGAVSGAIWDNPKCTNNCWNEMPLICDITWNQKKIFCSHGAMPLNKKGEWLEYEEDKYIQGKSNFLANWNENIFINDPPLGIEKSSRGAGYEIPIEKIFENMANNGYDWSIHGHVHRNQCGILKNKNKRVVTVVANEYYYNCNKTPFLPAVYIINDDNPNGTFFNLLQKQNEKIKEFYNKKPQNMELLKLNNCIIYEYEKTNDKKNENNQENQTNKEEQKEEVIYEENNNKEKKNVHNTTQKICCCCDICEK